MSVTIKDVARESGLAISTVSKYINGGNVREENREILADTIARLKYVPNTIARSLRTDTTHTVGVLIGTMNDEHVIAIMNTLESTLRDAGYLCMVCNHQGDRKEAEGSLKFLFEKQVDGIIMEGTTNTDLYLERIKMAGIPFVCLETNMSTMEVDAVIIDGTHGAYLAIESLLKKGHREVGIIAGPKDFYTADERVRGCRRAFEDYGFPFHEELVYYGDYSYQSGIDGFSSFWNRDERPTAIFTSNYYICMGVLNEVRRRGLRIPEDLSIVTYDDMELPMLVRPHLSAVNQPFDVLGRETAKVLLRRMQNDYSDFPLQIRLGTTFTERESVGTCPVR